MADLEQEPGTPEEPTPEAPPQETPEETPKEEPKAEAKPLAPEPDWRKAYEAEQKTSSRLARRLDETMGTTRELTEALKIIRTGQEAIAKATLPPEQAEAFILQGKAAEEASRQKRNTDQAAKLVIAQQNILKATLEGAGIDPKTIDWADDAQSVEEWTERVHASVRTNIGKARDGLLSSVDKAVTAKSKELEEKQKEALRRERRAAGLDQIDTAQGQPSTFAQRLARMDPNSKEFADLTDQVMAGRIPH